MEKKYTKGEWRIRRFSNSSNIDIMAATKHEEGTVCKIEYVGIFADESESTANAKLIAAAPDLLEACLMAKEIIGALPEEWGNLYHEKSFRSILLNAIKKATE